MGGGGEHDAEDEEEGEEEGAEVDEEEGEEVDEEAGEASLAATPLARQVVELMRKEALLPTTSGRWITLPPTAQQSGADSAEDEGEGGHWQGDRYSSSGHRSYSSSRRGPVVVDPCFLSGNGQPGRSSSGSGSSSSRNSAGSSNSSSGVKSRGKGIPDQKLRELLDSWSITSAVLHGYGPLVVGLQHAPHSAIVSSAQKSEEDKPSKKGRVSKGKKGKGVKDVKAKAEAEAEAKAKERDAQVTTDTHTHAHTHAQTHTPIHKDTHTPSHTHTHLDTQTPSHTH